MPGDQYVARPDFRIAKLLTLFLLAFFAGAVVMGWLNQLMAVGAWTRRLAFPTAISCAFLAVWMHSGPGRARVWLCVAFAPILAAVLALSSLYLDQSWDGLAYHQRAVIALLDGVNFLSHLQPTQNLWVDTYAKATWYYGATLVSWFGLSSLGASYHFILSLAAAAYLYRFCRWAGRGVGLASVVAVLWILNPVAICQWFTYYNDAAVGSLGLVLFLAAIFMVRQGDRLDKTIFLVSAVLVINVKASGFILVGTAFLYIFIEYLRNTRNVRAAMARVGCPFAVFCVVGIGVLGYSPYMQNVVHGRHVFYPLAGAEKVDIINCCAPYGFPEHGRLRNLFVSIFSRSVNAHPGMGPDAIQLKIPGKIFDEEKYTFREPDTRIGGFGPLFSLMLIVGIVTLPLLRLEWSIAGPLFFLVALSTVINPHAWWARYAPLIWLFPMIPVIGMKRPRLYIGAGVLVLFFAAAVANVEQVLQMWVNYQPVLDATIKQEAQALRATKLKVYSEIFAPQLELRELGLDYVMVTKEYYLANKADFKPLVREVYYAVDR